MGKYFTVLIFWCIFTVRSVFTKVENVNDLSKATTSFALKLLQANGNFNESTIVSPASIAVCLGMVYMGSNNETKSQINKAIFDNLADQTIKDQMRNMSNLLYKPSMNYTLSIANRLYGQKDHDLLKSFKDVLKTYFDTEMFTRDFLNNAEVVRQEINSWVEEETNHKIKDLIPKKALQGVALVLVNAVYFKGDWSLQFNESQTTKKPFYSSENKNVEVNMMKQKNKEFYFTQNDNVQVLGMPYVGDDLAMYIVLPKERYGLRQVETQLTGESLTGLIQQAAKIKILEIQIPKFKLEKKFDLKEDFKNLGMTDMFDSSKADFSGIDGRKSLFVSKVLHKAYVEVNEKGTEAAAASAVLLPPGSIPLAQLNPSFIADHPFLFIIVDQRNKNPIFFGRYVG